MKTFAINGLKLVTEVTRIIDADTIEVKASIPLKVLANHKVIKKRPRGEHNVVEFTGGYDDDCAMHIIVKCRFSEIDAYEKDTDAGKKAIEVLKTYINVGDTITCDFLKKGAFGRYIVDIEVNNERLIPKLLENTECFRTYEARLADKK